MSSLSLGRIEYIKPYMREYGVSERDPQVMQLGDLILELMDLQRSSYPSPDNLLYNDCVLYRKELITERLNDLTPKVYSGAH